MRDGDLWVRAKVVSSASPYQMWERNLNSVTEALGRAGVPYFCVPSLNPQRSVVAVDAGYREAAINAIRETADRDAVIRFESPRGTGVLQVFRPVTNTKGTLVLGRTYACEIEFWRRLSGPDGRERLVGPRENRVGHELPSAGESAKVSALSLTQFAPVTSPRNYRTRAEFTGTGPDQITFPIDVVYTWVDGSDPDWVARKNRAAMEVGQIDLNATAANTSRYVNRDELRYSMRSVYSYAPWVRHVYLVTDDQLPAWLDPNHSWITVVPHREIFGGTGRLPTFNSHAIESRLHRIPGLAEHFLYFNDDMFLGRVTLPTTFFHPNGVAKFFPSPGKIELGEVTLDDSPAMAAGKNNRAIIHQRFGRTITQKIRHVPYALRRSVLEEIERELPEEVAATSTHQFRHPEDLSIVSSLHHYWALMTGRAVTDAITYTYCDVSHPSTPVQLVSLLRHRDREVFCLNDTDSNERSFAEQHRMLGEFLSAYFPFRAPFEMSEEVERKRRSCTATELARALLDDQMTVRQRT